MRAETFPFNKIPGRITMELVSSCVLWLNVYTRKSGVSDIISTRTIIIGLMIDYNKHCKIHFLYYVQTHESRNKITGTVCTIGAMYLCPTGNEQGGYYFYSISTFRTIKHNRCTPLIIPWWQYYPHLLPCKKQHNSNNIYLQEWKQNRGRWWRQWLCPIRWRGNPGQWVW